MFKKFLIILMVISLPGSAGCWDAQEINDKAVTTSIGLALNEEDGQLRFSCLFTSPSSPGDSSGSGQTMPAITVSKDYGAAMAARRSLLSLSKIPEYAHVRSMIIGDKLAQKDLSACIDLITRNRNISPEINLFIGDNSSPEEILRLVNDSDRSLKRLVTVNELLSGIYVPVTLSDFVYKLLTPGIEPAVPQIAVRAIKSPKTSVTSVQDKTENMPGNSKRAILQGTAVFRKDKMVGSFTEYESRGYRWLASGTKMGGLFVIECPYEPGTYSVLEILRFSSSTKPIVQGGKITMQITIKTRLALIEKTSGMETIIKPANLEEIEKAAKQEIARQLDSCIRKAQSLHSDVLGWGLLLLQNQPDTWKQVKGNWNNHFADIGYELHIEADIIHTNLSK
ncbi:MAG TPA: Ger(x)C family spore germination protein [Syntrophomonas sp.]|nr:Ger(x)C family spore germination protein [Syntrophomonas sp.]